MNKKKGFIIVPLMIIVLTMLSGCGKKNRIDPPKDYTAFVSDFDFLDDTTKEIIGDLIESSVEWYNSVEIPEDYADVDTDLFDDAKFTDYGKQLMDMQTYDSKSEEAMRFLHATMPAVDISGKIYTVVMENNRTFGSDGTNLIEMSKEDWDDLEGRIQTAIDFYYGDGDRSSVLQ